MRNLGDGFDDEECPERESWTWEMRSTRAPGQHQLDFKDLISKLSKINVNGWVDILTRQAQGGGRMEKFC